MSRQLDSERGYEAFTETPQTVSAESRVPTREATSQAPRGGLAGAPDGAYPRAVALGYKRTEVGVIPEDWDAVRIDGLTDVDPENLPSSTDQGFRFNYISLDNVHGGRLLGHSRESFGTAPSRARRVLRVNDVLMSTVRPALLGHLLYRVQVPNAVCSTGFAVLRAKRSHCEPRFLFAHLFGDAVSIQLEALLAGSNYPAINKSDVEKLRVTCPPTLKEQRAIAAAFSDADELIGSLEALIAKKRDIKQAAMQQLLTGRTRLPGFGGEWETRRLEDHLKFLRHGSIPRSELSADDPVKYLHYGDIHKATDMYLNPNVRAMPTLAADRARSLDRLDDGDLVFVDASEDAEGVGKSVEIMGLRGQHVVSGLHTIAARFRKSVLADGFKGYLQYHPAFRRHLRRLAAGTKVYATNRAHIASAELRLPPLPEQRAIATVLSDVDTEIAALEHRLDKTRAIKQGMMQQLLTGRTRLIDPHASPHGEAAE